MVYARTKMVNVFVFWSREEVTRNKLFFLNSRKNHVSDVLNYKLCLDIFDNIYGWVIIQSTRRRRYDFKKRKLGLFSLFVEALIFDCKFYICNTRLKQED